MKYFVLFLALLLPSIAQAEMHEVKMLNRNETGSMVYDPPYLAIKPGDTVKFLATQLSHNAASIKGMIPEGAEHFKGQIDEEIEVTFTVPGAYGVKCTPHYSMGMVMIIQVGDDIPSEDFITKKVPTRSKKRMKQYIRDYKASLK